MNIDKKILSIPTIMILVLMLTVCYASSQSFSGIPSGENIYIDSVEEYEELINNENGFTQLELKEYYEYYMENYKSHIDNEFGRTPTVKANVIKSESVEEKYELDTGYQGEQQYTVPYKYSSQMIEVEILEGEYQGQKFEIEYILDADMFNNLKYAPFKKGDTVFVTINSDEETGEINVQLSEDGVNIERFGTIVFLAIIAIVLLAVYGGKKGIFASLIILLAGVFCIIIIPNMFNNNSGLIITSLILMILLTVLVSILKIGKNKNLLKAIIISSMLTFITTIVIIFVNNMLNITGATLEAIAFSNLTIVTGANLESIYVLTTLIIASFAITNVVCKTLVKLSENQNIKGFNEKLDICKGAMTSDIMAIAITILALYIPNHLYLISNRYTAIEICNAETLLSEIIRIIILVIAMTLAVPTVIVFSKDEK